MPNIHETRSRGEYSTRLHDRVGGLRQCGVLFEATANERVHFRFAQDILGRRSRRRIGELNPHEEGLRDQGVRIDVPDRFTNRQNFPRRTSFEPLTGLPTEEGKFRTEIVKEFSKTLREGKGWAMLYSDADNLKTANTFHGRDLGDMVIRQGASSVTSLVEDMGFPEDVKIYAFRRGSGAGGADETVVCIFNLNNEQLTQIQQVTKEANKPVSISKPEFTFSNSVVAITSSDEAIQESMAATRQFLDEDRRRLAYNEFRDLLQRSDDEAKLLKISKDIGRLSVESLSQEEFSDEIMDIFVEELGNTRISKPLLKTILTVTQQSTIMDMLTYMDKITSDDPPQAARIKMIRQLGMDQRIAEQYTIEDLRVIYYDHILHMVYEQAGINTQ